MCPREIVRSGYNRIASSYAGIRTGKSEDVRLLNFLIERLPKGAMVLDAGCGSGVPVTKSLAEHFQVIGVDFAEEQIRLARENVPDTEFSCADIVKLPFRGGTFDAVCSYYAIINVPRVEHHELLVGFHRVLRPRGFVLLCTGAGDLPDDIGDWLGTPMFWSHYDGETNLRMIKESGFDILWFRNVDDPIDPHSSHLFVLGRKGSLP